MKKLGIESIDTKLLLMTMHGTQEIKTKAVDGLVATHYQELDICITLPRTYVREQIPANRDENPQPERLQE